MSETKHTPGPWTFSTSPQPNGCPIVGARGLMVAMLAHSVNEPKQVDTAIANANLIAAAPDMLDALEDVDEWLMDDRYNLPDDVVEKIRAAIKKARGER